ncbi:TetR/AcrR family transcriptional regulator [Nocardia miyunensis]|uniref:TetR/AcrR family transcriptional regulator n=1 Tax=Nocardia miyunensis TaxID=282684 RepID=UPI00082C61A8|nr:TetR/AcrR family transcriptional regulator [Nocardia miyunensis]
MDATTRRMRADARRNYERILECARQTFAELGTEAPLDEIARRTGVGPGTLYRHFPNRAALIEAVYRSSIEALSRRAEELLDSEYTPLEALDLWVRAQVDFVMNRRGLAVTLKAALDRDSDIFMLCSTIATEAATAVLRPAQEAGLVRPELEPQDLIRLGHGVGAACEHTPEAAERLLTVVLAGLRTPQ